jgi:hypothetical protein
MQNKIYLKRLTAGDARNEKIKEILLKKEVPCCERTLRQTMFVLHLRLLIFCKKYGIK